MNEQWWPKRENWPDIRESGDTEQALALMILEEFLVLLHSDGALAPLFLCSDTFAYACADAEPLPPVSFGNDEPFWELYDAIRLHGYRGGVKWTALRRGTRPIPPFVERLKESGLWDEELEKLPGIYKKK